MHKQTVSPIILDMIMFLPLIIALLDVLVLNILFYLTIIFNQGFYITSRLNAYVHQTVFNSKTKIYMYLNTTITCWNFEKKIIYNIYVYTLSFYFTNNSFLISLYNFIPLLCEDVNVWKKPWGGRNITWKNIYWVSIVLWN